MERDKCFSSLLHSICEGLNSFFSSETQKKMCLMCLRKKLYLSPLLKDGHSRMTLELKPRIRKFSLLYATLLRSGIQWFHARGKVKKQERSRSSALKSIFFRESVTCIHRSKFVVMQVCNLSKRVICEKLSFLHGLDVLIKMFVNSLTVLNQHQQTLGRIDHVHCFQTQLTESCLVFGSAQTRDSSVIGFSL